MGFHGMELASKKWEQFYGKLWVIPSHFFLTSRKRSVDFWAYFITSLGPLLV